MLILDSDCTMRDNHLTIKATNSIQTNISSSSFQPKLNITFNSEVNNSDIIPTFSHMKSNSHKQEFKNITEELKQLKLHQKKLSQLQPHDVHQFTISYITIGIIILIIAYLITTRCRSSSNEAKTVQRTSRPSDYNFEVTNFNRRQHVETST